MAKNKSFTQEEKRALSIAQLDWRLWEPLQQLPNSMIIRHRLTGDVKVIEKRRIPS